MLHGSLDTITDRMVLEAALNYDGEGDGRKPASDSGAAGSCFASSSSAGLYFGAAEDSVPSLQFSEAFKHMLKCFA